MIEVTEDLIAWLGKLPKAKRQKYYLAIGKSEWERCADDMLYWMDPSKHALPYVYTRDPKPLYSCNLCKDGASHFFDRRDHHLSFRHGIAAEGEVQRRSYFTALDTTRPFTMFDYVEPIAQAWLRDKIVLVEKSRDMMMTWLSVVMYTWDTIFHQNRENIFQSEDSTKTLDLVGRAHFIWSNQPKFLRDQYTPKVTFGAGTSRAGVLSVPHLNSFILGFPQGGDQIRQYHPSGCFLDEMAFQQKASEAFMAIKPAIQAGGRLTGVSSANPGFFYAAVRDVIET